jgi:para-nitrobenzyl esterase
MVWLHGGGNVEGSAARTLYDGAAFARDSVVFVSVDYRLGLLGFFAHPSLTAAAGTEPAANFGLQDQVAALEWVKRNVAQFGGDPANVTVFGESAGGEDIRNLMNMPAARGLFERAIIESGGGGWQNPPTMREAENAGAAVATALRLPGSNTTVAQLRGVPAESILALGDSLLTGPIVDGKVLLKPPLAGFADGSAMDVPLIVGTNSEEGSLLTEAPAFGALFPRINPANLARLRASYGAAATADSDFTKLLFRDGYFAGPSRAIARRKASAPTWLYRFDYVLSVLRRTRAGATHGSELPYVFTNWPLPLVIPGDRHIQNVMHGCWVAFARTGEPQCAGMPAWPRYDAITDRLMLIGDTLAAAPNPAGPVLDILAQLLHH